MYEAASDGAHCCLFVNWTASRYQIRKNVSRILHLSDSLLVTTIVGECLDNEDEVVARSFRWGNHDIPKSDVTGLTAL